MPILQTLYDIFIESLFPLSKAEKELFSYTPTNAYEILPKSPPALDGFAVAVFHYKDERVQRLIWNIKYKRSVEAVEMGGYALFQELKKMNLPPSTIIVPMPITKRRRRERGYNQCELLTSEIIKLDTLGYFNIRTDILLRTHHANRQTLKGRTDRLKDAKGVFSLNKTVADQYLDHTIVIIDDVITTGSTISDAINTFKEAGFKNVQGLTLAH